MTVGKSRTIWTRNFISIFIINFISGFGQQLANTLISPYASSLGAAEALVGTIAGATAVFALVIRPITGPAIVSFDNKKLLICAYTLNAVGNISYGFITNPSLLLFARACAGFGLGIGAPLCMVIASDSLPEDRMASGLGVFSLALAISQAVGPSVGLALRDAAGYRTTFFIAAGINVLAIVSALILRLPEKERTAFRVRLDTIIAREAVCPALILMCLNLAYSTFSAFMVLYAESKHIEGVGTFFTIYAMVLLVSRPVSGFLGDRFGPKAVFYPGVAMFAAAFLLIAYASSLPVLLASAAIAAVGYGSCQPMMQALCIRSVSRERRGAASSTNYIGTDLGHFFGPVIAGLVVERMGYSVMYMAAILPLILSVFIFFFVKMPKNAAED